MRFRDTNFAQEVRLVTDERIENYDVIRGHDERMMEYFTMWIVFRDEASEELREGRVPLVFATPKRDYTTDDEQLTAMQFEGESPPTQMERIVYPGMTLTRLDVSFDQTRWSGADWRRLAYSSDLNLVMASNFPLPYNFSYQLDMWADTHSDLNALTEQFARKFPRPTHWLDIDYPLPWGTQTVHMQQQGQLAYGGRLEGGEDIRDLRAVATVIVFGWIPLPPRWVRTVQKFRMEMVEERSGEILEAYISEAADKRQFWETGDAEQTLEWT